MIRGLNVLLLALALLLSSLATAQTVVNDSVPITITVRPGDELTLKMDLDSVPASSDSWFFTANLISTPIPRNTSIVPDQSLLSAQWTDASNSSTTTFYDSSVFHKGYVQTKTSHVTDTALYLQISSYAFVYETVGNWTMMAAISAANPFYGIAPMNTSANVTGTDASKAAIFANYLSSNNTLLNTTTMPSKTIESMPSEYSAFLYEGTNALRDLHLSYVAISSGPYVKGLTYNITAKNVTDSKVVQLLVDGLDANTTYTAYVVANKTVFMPITLTTQTSNTTCKLVYNLDFCENVAYAVPGNSTVSAEDLAATYDDWAKAEYQNFTYALQNSPCNLQPADLRYTILATCDDCAAAYKRWLCAVVVPQCTDVSSGIGYTRNFTNPLTASRYPNIDSVIQPGKYNEILPCGFLCHDLVRVCPSSLSFMCPKGTQYYHSYADYYANGTCNSCGFNQLPSLSTSSSPEYDGVPKNMASANMASKKKLVCALLLSMVYYL